MLHSFKSHAPTAFLCTKSSLNSAHSSNERMQRTTQLENIFNRQTMHTTDGMNCKKRRKKNTHLKMYSFRCLTFTPVPLFLMLSPLSPSAWFLPLHFPCLQTPLEERKRAREGVPNTDTFLLLLLLLRPSCSKQQQ